MAGWKIKEPAMRLQGHLSEWDDKRGFGFITPSGGGEKVKMHISAYRGTSTMRPADGQLLSYQVETNPKGRPTAVAATPARAGARPRSSAGASALGKGSQAWRVITGLFALSALTTLASVQLLPWPLVGACLGMSLWAWLAYALDKRAAQRGNRRTPENSLLLYGLLGGWPGALIAQGQFRHKTAKLRFQAPFWLCVVLNLSALLAAPGLLEKLGG